MAPQFMAMMQVLFDPLERVAKLAIFGLIGGLAAMRTKSGRPGPKQRAGD
jgi:hypothetical protein